MKKISIFFAAALFFLTTNAVNAEPDDYKMFYIGGGVSYGIENFSGSGDWDNSWGINAKVGYHFMDIASVQFDYDYLWGFEDSGSIDIFGNTFDGDAELDIMTYILSLKGHYPVKWYNVISPFVLMGVGIMNVDSDFKIQGASNSSGEETDVCGKIGAGFDFFFSDHFSLNLEGNYTRGFRDLDDIQYFNFILGGLIRFDLPHGNHKF